VLKEQPEAVRIVRNRFRRDAIPGSAMQDSHEQDDSA
jgi:hypothetical protein